MDNSQIGNIVLFLYPIPNSLILPSLLNKKAGFIYWIAPNIIKNKTIELLTLTKMEHLFNENDFKYYFKKLTKNKGNYNLSILSYSIALSYPNIVKRVGALSGYLNLDITVDNYQNNDFSNLKIFTSHGTADQVIPVEWARKTDPILNNLGINSTYREYPIGHGVSPQNFFDFKNWIVFWFFKR